MLRGVGIFASTEASDECIWLGAEHYWAAVPRLSARVLSRSLACWCRRLLAGTEVQCSSWQASCRRRFLLDRFADRGTTQQRMRTRQRGVNLTTSINSSMAACSRPSTTAVEKHVSKWLCNITPVRPLQRGLHR